MFSKNWQLSFSYPLYDTVIPATSAFSHPMTKKKRDRKYPRRDVPRANLAAPMMLSLNFFMITPPENIPKATAGMLITPEKTGHLEKPDQRTVS